MAIFPLAVHGSKSSIGGIDTAKRLKVQKDETAPSPDMLRALSRAVDKGAAMASHEEHLFRAASRAESRRRGRAFTRTSHQGAKRGIMRNLFITEASARTTKGFWALPKLRDGAKARRTLYSSRTLK